MIVRADLTKDQADVIRAEATRLGCTPNELARRWLANILYGIEVRHMDPTRQPKQHVGEEWA